jgi:protein SSD1
VSDLTHRYGPVVRQARVVNVLDAAFDVLIPEFGIEKRVHVDQMPIEVKPTPNAGMFEVSSHLDIQNHVYDEHSHTLQIYWSDKDVITWLAENSDDDHLKKVKQTAEQHAAKMEVASRSVHDEKALFDEDDETEEDEVVLKRLDAPTEATKIETSKQRQISAAKVPPKFEGLRTPAAGHYVQDIQELMTVPVCDCPVLLSGKQTQMVSFYRSLSQLTSQRALL